MSNVAIQNLWSELIGGLQTPGLLWQLAAVAASLILATVLTRLTSQRFSGSRLNQYAERNPFLHLLCDAAGVIFAPALGLGLIAVVWLVSRHWQRVAALEIALPLLTSFVLIRLGFYLLRRLFARGGKLGSVVLLFEKIFVIVVWACVALYITGLWPELIEFVERFLVPIGRRKVSLLTILQAVASVAVTLILALWTGALLEAHLMQLETMHSSLRVVSARLGKAALIVVALLLSLALVGIDLTVLSVFGGALGVGLGLGLQKIFGSYLSGFVILFERSLAIGDMVTVDKYFGLVTKINTRYTVLRALDGVETIVPNDLLVSGPIQNYSLTDRTIRLGTAVTVAYQTDIEFTLQLLQQTAVSVPRVLPTPEPAALLAKFGTDGAELEVSFWITDPENGRLNVVSDVNRAIWRVLQAHQIQVPVPQREVTVRRDVGSPEPPSGIA